MKTILTSNGGTLTPAVCTANKNYKDVDFHFIIDNGHGTDTKGKFSPLFPDGSRFYEYEFNRAVVAKMIPKMDALGIKYDITVKELTDPSLGERVRRANALCDKYGVNKCLFISVHGNAAGNADKWMNARGWCVFTTEGKTKSDDYATIFYEEAEKLLPKHGMTLRKDMSDGDPDWEYPFYVCRNTKCPAILTENLFYDNKVDVEFMKSEAGKDVIAQIHVNAMCRILDKLTKN